MSKKKKYLRNLSDFIFSEDTEQKEYIYFLVCEIDKHRDWINRVKTGRTENIKKRIKNLSTGGASPLKPWYLFPVPKKDASKLEKNLHKRFRRIKVNNEWFKIKPPIRNFIKAHKKLFEESQKKICNKSRVILRKRNVCVKY